MKIYSDLFYKLNWKTNNKREEKKTLKKRMSGHVGKNLLFITVYDQSEKPFSRSIDGLCWCNRERVNIFCFGWQNKAGSKLKKILRVNIEQAYTDSVYIDLSLLRLTPTLIADTCWHAKSPQSGSGVQVDISTDQCRDKSI